MTIRMDFSLQVLVFGAIAAILLLISSSLIADSAREFKVVWSYWFPSALNKLRAAAVSPTEPNLSMLPF